VSTKERVVFLDRAAFTTDEASAQALVALLEAMVADATRREQANSS
jgi:hypothetical protein